MEFYFTCKGRTELKTRENIIAIIIIIIIIILTYSMEQSPS